MIVALAGRRIDEERVEPQRFPLRNVDIVRARLCDFFTGEGVAGVVCSGACGADLIALDEAWGLKLSVRMILPYEKDLFLKSSVTDRPGDWGRKFLTVFEGLKAEGNVRVLELPFNDPSTYARTNDAILNEAESLGTQQRNPVAAAIVWDGKPWGSDDTTELFREEARSRGLNVFPISTLDD